ncbi:MULTISPECIES: transposase [Streptomyces]|uniref:Transposase n=1 Tax=Streptomyces alfalfae TaxID=1642299 RepID=A0A7T4PM45_9ACTN|nr:transposase [Streptomyces alfalfae]
MLVIDDSGDRKDGTTTARLSRLGRTDNGNATVTTVWTDGQGVLPTACTAVHPRPSFRPWPGRPRLHAAAPTSSTHVNGSRLPAAAAGRTSGRHHHKEAAPELLMHSCSAIGDPSGF